MSQQEEARRALDLECIEACEQGLRRFARDHFKEHSVEWAQLMSSAETLRQAVGDLRALTATAPQTQPDAWLLSWHAMDELSGLPWCGDLPYLSRITAEYNATKFQTEFGATTEIHALYRGAAPQQWQPEWRSIESDPPPLYVDVMWLTEDRRVIPGYRNQNGAATTLGRFSHLCGKLIKWAPLPAAPQVQETDK